MSEYKKVSDIEVLKKYHEIQSEMNKLGFWRDYLSIEFLAKELKTSKYRIQKAYKSLKEKRIYRIKTSTYYIWRLR